MIEQFNFDIQLIFAILNGKVSAAINRKLSRNFRQNGMEITPEQWTVLLFLWEKDGVTQQELCNATFKDKPSMTRLIDNMERQHLVVRISDKKDRRTNLIHLTKTGKELEEMARFIANKTLKSSTLRAIKGGSSRADIGGIKSEPGSSTQNLYQYKRLRVSFFIFFHQIISSIQELSFNL